MVATSDEPTSPKEIRIAKKAQRRRKRMALRRRRPEALGLAPGSITAVPGAPPAVIRVISYDADGVDERSVERVSDLKSIRDRSTGVSWINVDGIGDPECLSQLGELFGLHALALEDVVNVHQRPKFEDYGNTDFVVLRMPSLRPQLDLEQVSVFVGDRFVITIQERPGDCFDFLRDRIRNGKGRIRRRDGAYLAYSVLDAIVETFYPVVEGYSDQLEEIESRVLANQTENVVAEVHAVRHDLRALRRAVGPTREVLSAMARADASDSQGDTHIFLRDCHDHAVQLMEALDTNRELASSLMDMHLSNVSMRMNEVMKVLTIIATIFMPLGFIAGLYGMNFDGGVSRWNMPELRWEYGYFFAIGAMALTAIGLVLFFRSKGWLGDGGHEDKHQSEATKGTPDAGRD
ncbi:MAG: magnesium/cobalt transporter CorA [Myxococcales bacterium]|nr:magnesium/cobalt transporter CorA [Deltaproteobacteria bacterium]NNK06177.1 magnesium/cobalt transporter CorA [Myxococcales bacterium]NNL24387.1 magnesium/cobalt transporter CorA [Myxococcales bacterium]